ncbi:MULTISPECIES: carbohydrate porin [Niveibacterium]|uniref:Carbohydrate porin n=1 Tax=Niveibacterium microcysteis TaxID=2811415 RepID=A0ABX7M662_9RHOO|nr:MULTISPECIES: carbohydrate porin [Niveibacterium]QSI77235.1 carbohydrate porin [Niveibacterium microcysteis]
MKHIVVGSTFALALAGFSSVAFCAEALEFHGYMRAGMGINADGGKGACYGLGSINPFRLGNECDTVIEPTFTGRIASPTDKSAWGVTVMPKTYQRWGEVGGSSTLKTEFGQIYLFGENVPQLLNGRIWGGKRYYQRLQTGINDEFLENLDGDGVGIEDMDFGVGKFSVAWHGDIYGNASTDRFATLSGNTISARFAGVKTMPEGTLSFYGHYRKDSNRDDHSTTPVTTAPEANATTHIAAYHNLNGVLGGSNLIGIGYTSYENDKDVFDITIQQSGFVTGAKMGWDAIARYRKNSAKNNGIDSTEYAIGARLDGQISGPFRWLVEGGYNHVSPSQGESQSMWKITPTLALSAGNDPWSRPTFRLYWNYTSWSDSVTNPYRWSSEAQSVGRDVTQTSGSTIGVQAEAWW